MKLLKRLKDELESDSDVEVVSKHSGRNIPDRGWSSGYEGEGGGVLWAFIWVCYGYSCGQYMGMNVGIIWA